MQYGLQRTGTNWVSSLLKTNFGVNFQNGADRSSVLHKHTHKMFEMTFDEFDQEVTNALGGRRVDGYVVCVKHPHSWYVSFRKWCQKCKSPSFNAKGVNVEYIETYNRFYAKWIEYEEQYPERVIILRYESLIESLKPELDAFCARFQCNAGGGSYKNVTGRVPQSSEFTAASKASYLNEEWRKKLRGDEKDMLAAKTDTQVSETFGYK